MSRNEEEIIKNWNKNNNKPLVSICCITYKQEKYISQTIESFLMQDTSFPFEIVIGEDCSPDDTAKIVKKYVEKYPNIIRAKIRKKNLGMVENFIDTLKSAKGKYIALCEGDDYWIDSKKLQKQFECMEENRDLVLCGTRFFKDKIDGKIMREEGVYNFNNLLKTFNFAFLTLFFKRELLNNELFEFIRNKPIADWPFVLFLLQYGKGRVLSDITAVYRSGNEGLYSHLNSIDKKLLAYRCIESFYNDSLFGAKEKDILYTEARKYLKYVFEDKNSKNNIEVLKLIKNGYHIKNFEKSILYLLYKINHKLFRSAARRLL